MASSRETRSNDSPETKRGEGLILRIRYVHPTARYIDENDRGRSFVLRT